ncbi:MAG: phosphate ABC transporter, permease protein PstA, partial [bacterium]|nr:phosphate ABC transporter, permease protein PstA [bacterium]
MRIAPRHTQAAAVIVLGGATLLTLAVLVFIIFFVLEKGLPVLSLSFLFSNPQDMGRAGGIFPFVVGTALLTMLAIAIATPLGIGTAVFLCEYT